MIIGQTTLSLIDGFSPRGERLYAGIGRYIAGKWSTCRLRSNRLLAERAGLIENFMLLYKKIRAKV